MDLTDILFSKPFIGSSGGGGGSNVETATIEITVTDSTPAITSGEFPDWCTEANSEHIYGEINLENVYINGKGASGRLVVYEVISNGGKEAVIGGDKMGNKFVVAKDLSYVGSYGNTPATSGTLTINLIYMPEDTGGGGGNLDNQDDPGLAAN